MGKGGGLHLEGIESRIRAEKTVRWIDVFQSHDWHEYFRLLLCLVASASFVLGSDCYSSTRSRKRRETESETWLMVGAPRGFCPT